MGIVYRVLWGRGVYKVGCCGEEGMYRVGCCGEGGVYWVGCCGEGGVYRVGCRGKVPIWPTVSHYFEAAAIRQPTVSIHVVMLV